jgi:hypothetical protein
LRVRDLFADCSIRLEPVYLGWRVFLVPPDGEWFEHFESREAALTSAAIWAEMLDDDTELPNNRKDHAEEILDDLRERMMRHPAGEPAPTSESRAEAERLRR